MRFLATLGLMAAIPAQSVLIYDNGPLVTDPTGGAGGAPISVLQTAAPFNMNIIGANANNAANVRQADDFAVNAAMVISDIELFMYNTNATAPSCTGVFLSIFDGNPAAGTPNQLIPGAGSAVNLFTASGFTVSNTLTGIYRVTSTTLTNTARQLQSVRVTLPTPLVLAPGTYYLEYSFTGTTTPFFPPLTTPNVFATGNAQQSTAGVYAALQQTNNVTGLAIPGAFLGIPFRFYGPGGALPGAITNIGGGCSAATLSVGGAPNVGGYLRADLANVNAAALGVIILGTANPATPLGVCACTSSASLDVLTVGTSLELQIPAVASLVGLPLYVQGMQMDIVPVGSITNCNFLGLQLDLTDAFEFRLNVN